MTIRDQLRAVGMSESTYYSRRRRYGWTHDEAINSQKLPVGRKPGEAFPSAHTVRYKGALYTWSALGKLVGIRPETLKYRVIDKGKTVEEAVALPVRARRSPTMSYAEEGEGWHAEEESTGFSGGLTTYGRKVFHQREMVFGSIDEMPPTSGSGRTPAAGSGATRRSPTLQTHA